VKRELDSATAQQKPPSKLAAEVAAEASMPPPAKPPAKQPPKEVTTTKSVEPPKPAAQSAAASPGHLRRASPAPAPKARGRGHPRRGADSEEGTPSEGNDDDESEADLNGTPEASKARRSVMVGVGSRKRKTAPEEAGESCPELDDAICSVCNQDHAPSGNDLALCDKCDRGFHQMCHDPIVSSFGSSTDQWFCINCVKDLAKERNLKAKLGDFVWGIFSPGAPPWPARIHQIDFVSLADPRPYWVQYFDSGHPEGSWLGESNLLLWSEGPKFASIKESRRRLAVRMAEGDGAAPISSNGVAQAAIKALPKATRESFVEARRRTPASDANYPSQATPAKNRRLSVKSPPHHLLSEPVQTEDLELQSQVAEMKKMVQEAKDRQARLEQQVDEAMSQSQKY